MNVFSRLSLRAVVLCCAFSAVHAEPAKPSIDFSYAGYGGGGVPIPVVPAVLAIEPSGSDDTVAINDAISQLAERTPDANGFRGALVLRGGVFRVFGQIRISASGIVLRGGEDEYSPSPGPIRVVRRSAATILATGNSRRALIVVDAPAPTPPELPLIAIVSNAPAGSLQLQLANLDNVIVGRRITIRGSSTKAWISSLQMDQFAGSFKDLRLTWLPGSRDIVWTRRIVAVDPNTRMITLDAPITTALKANTSTVQILHDAPPLENIGIENLSIAGESGSAPNADEERAWIGIQMDHTENAWVRDVAAGYFVSAAVWLGADTRAITVRDCRISDPRGHDAGWRRFGFYVGGQQTLVQRCRAEGARHPFLAGLCSGGPNVFLECEGSGITGESGSIESWATGALFDNVKISGGALVLGNLGERWQGAGWNAANSVLWNCTATQLVADSPPGAANAAISDAETPSLYRDQLGRRVGHDRASILDQTFVAPKADRDLPSPIAWGQITESQCGVAPLELAVKNGRFVDKSSGSAIFGSASSNAWWKGQTVPARAADLGWSATRWAPGRNGPGLTEDLSELSDRLAANGTALVQVWPGLWYDRRRDDHTTTMRADAEVWAPFYEMPWARSGQGTAADGLSKYDLTEFNPWYWNRLREFADACAANGQILYHHFYNHHNLIEAAAHWAEFPWRTANALQDTGFAEPPPYENDGKRINIVAEFYDISHPTRRALHRLFIWHGLDQFADKPNVIHTLGFQFAGPLTFQQFFLDTVAEWEAVRGRRALIMLNTSKSITDAILADPTRALHVAGVDQRNWQYVADGTLFAPHSNGSLAFRENRVAVFGKDAVPPSTPELVYQQVREYRDRFPKLAIITSHAGQGPIPILMAGGSLPLLADYAAAQPLKLDRDDRALFKFIAAHVGSALPSMLPSEFAPGVWALSDAEGRHLIYSASGESIRPKQHPRIKTLRWFNPRTGQTTEQKDTASGGEIKKPDSGAWLLLLEATPTNSP